MQCDPVVRRPAAAAGWVPSKGTRRPEPAGLRRKGRRRCCLAAPGTRDSASGTGSTLAEIAQIPGERLTLASAASRRRAARAGTHAWPVARIGELLAGIAEIPGEAFERVGLTPAALGRPAARAGAYAAATSLIGESLAGIAEIPGACMRPFRRLDRGATARSGPAVSSRCRTGLGRSVEIGEMVTMRELAEIPGESVRKGST